MKVIIQIPCFNEEQALPVTLRALPRAIPGVDSVEWLVIDDGSTDRTSEVARAAGADHVVRHARRQGLAAAFMTGLDAALKAGADIIVNTDADNQYNAEDIPALVAPIIGGKADLVIGARPISAIRHFSPVKKLLQWIGSKVVRIASGTDVPDAPSGFRAISRKAALRLNVFSAYTYTLETIIQAGKTGIAVASVPVRVNEELRPSRLVKSIPQYIQWSMVTIVRAFMAYQPLRFFMYLGALFALAGFALGVRFLWYWWTEGGGGHVQSLILTAILLTIGFQFALIGLLADLIAVNRKLLEDIQRRVREMEIDHDR
jgi:glycosyltransferase involved in cell wall biosynthesis